MKKQKLINLTKLYLVPLIIVVMITILTSYMLYTNVNKKYHNIYVENSMSYSNSYAEKIVDNKKIEEAIKDSIFNKLLNVSKIALGHESLLSEQYLKELRDDHEISNLAYLNFDGKVIYHTFDNFTNYQMKEGDPIYNFINSDLKHHFEDVRKSITSESNNMYVYLKNDRLDHFIQASISSDYVYNLTNNYKYDVLLNDIYNSNKQILNVFVVNKNGTITLTDGSISPYTLDDDDFNEVFNGKSLYEERFSNALNEQVLATVSPIKINDNIEEAIVIYYSLEFYKTITHEVLLVMFVLSVFIILSGLSLLLFFVIIPLSSLEKSLSSLDANFGTYNKPKKEYSVFQGAFKSLDDLSAHIKDVNTQNRKLNESIYELALTDYLTNLPNRMKLIDSINKYKRENKTFALIFLDIDNFKTYNDTKGHIYGDRLLIEFVKRINTLKNDKVFISRYGGDEFILLLKYNNDEEINDFIKKLYNTFNTPLFVNKELNYIDLSVGISKYPTDATTSSELIRKADIAMYYGKEINKNTHIYYNESLDKNLEEELYIKTKIEDALINDGFKVVLQPQVNVYNNEIVSYEALARFKNLNIGPYKFIKVAEKYGLINDLGKVIIKKVVEILNDLKKENKLKTVYANFSIIELSDKTLIDFILNELKKYDIDPTYFGIEITEGVLIENEKESINFFEKLKCYGFKVAIDDFGSGNASLSYLIEYPLRLVKLDRSFINKYLTKENINIFNTVVYLANQLDYEIIAEGIEDEEQIALLKETKCKLVQGYYYFKPMEVKDILKIKDK